ncbi:reticulon-like protein B21 isoform X2 [Daucus carota subsp. sativus]|uniref:reticulon-like protein B21 isoform X2 n=1 Tax=Daucus carota subsp. sativus TaxID=79200 RepID=UPI00308301DB
MKFNKVNEVVKVFNGDHETESPVKGICGADQSNDGATQVQKRVRPKQSLDATSGKRKTWGAETVQITKGGSGLRYSMEEQCKELSVSVENSVGMSELSEKNDEKQTKRSPVKVSRQKSEVSKNVEVKCKELSDSVDGSKIQIARKRSEWSKNLDEQTKELSVSADGIKNSPSKIRRTRSELIRELSVSVDGMEKSPVRSMRTRAMAQKESKGLGGEIDRSSVQLRKVKSASSKGSSVANESNAALRKTRSEASKDSNVPGNSSEGVSSELVKFESLSDKVVGDSGRMSTESGDSLCKSIELVDESEKVLEESVGGIKESSVGIAMCSSDVNSEELIECEEKTITSNLVNVSLIKPPPKLEVTDDEDDWEEELELEEEFDEEIETETIKKSLDVIEIGIPEEKAKKIVIEEKKIQESNLRSSPTSMTVKKQTPPVAIHPRIVSKSTKTTAIPVADEYYSVPKRHSKLQSLVDLVMWRDASKSAFIFGLGTFVIMSSSYTTDLNISGVTEEDETDQEYVFGVEEAIWLLKMILPYVNEFLLKARALFSGDPATTMKLAVLLFVLARCGSSITIWKMAKLGFFGAFTVPKICSSYSSQLTAFGTFWIRRIRDAWESCSQKKAVGFFLFTLIWNLSSVVARIWAVFMVFVAFKYYQQSLSDGEDWIKDDAEEEISGKSSSSLVLVEEKKNKSCKQIIGGRMRRQGPGPTILETKKPKKPIS